MVSATILTPPSTGRMMYSAFPPEPYIPEEPEYEKNIKNIPMYGEKL